MKQAKYPVALLLTGLLGTAVAAGATQETTAAALGLARYAEPEYPGLLSHQGVTKGSVTIAITWDDEGKPADVFAVSSTHPLFAEAALDAARSWRLAPGNIERSRWRGSVVRLEFNYGGISGVTKTEMEKLDEILSTRRARKPVRLTDLDAPPRALAQPMPRFPAALRGHVKHARVVVAFYLDTDGSVRAPSVQEATAPEFAAEAVAAMRRWRFEPPRRRGRPVVVADAWEFEFSERNGS